MHSRGFTLIELLLVIALISGVAALSSINLLPARSRSSLGSAVNLITADLRAQQFRSQQLETAGGSAYYGVHFSPNQYILFHGNVYVPDSPENFTVNLPSGVTLSTSFSNQSVIFSPGSGEITNFNSSAASLVFTDLTGSLSRTVSFNAYGIPVSQTP